MDFERVADDHYLDELVLEEYLRSAVDVHLFVLLRYG